jgi:hypothetical protein
MNPRLFPSQPFPEGMRSAGAAGRKRRAVKEMKNETFDKGGSLNGES